MKVRVKWLGFHDNKTHESDVMESPDEVRIFINETLGDPEAQFAHLVDAATGRLVSFTEFEKQTKTPSNEYIVQYFKNGFRTSKSFESREEAEIFKKEKSSSSPYGSYLSWKEIVPEDLGPYPDTRVIKEYVPGNVVKVVKSFRGQNKPDEYIGKIAIIIGSYSTLLQFGTGHGVCDDEHLHEYSLAFLDGDTSAWWDQDKLEFISVGDPTLLNMWLRKYSHVNSDDTIMLSNEIKKIEENKKAREKEK